MGLDMYLERMPRYNNTTAKQVCALQNYFEWKRNPDAKKYTLKEWCGIDFKEVPSKHVRDFYEPFFVKQYSVWDTDRQYGWCRIMEEVGYWRKANHIHRWFVEHVQDGEDDCDYHDEVTKEVLEELLDTCHEVLCNPDLAASRLPTQGGFFFGDTTYDEYYIESIRNTMSVITEILDTTDFEKEMIYYCSSW